MGCSSSRRAALRQRTVDLGLAFDVSSSPTLSSYSTVPRPADARRRQRLFCAVDKRARRHPAVRDWLQDGRSTARAASACRGNHCRPSSGSSPTRALCRGRSPPRRRWSFVRGVARRACCLGAPARSRLPRAAPRAAAVPTARGRRRAPRPAGRARPPRPAGVPFWSGMRVALVRGRSHAESGQPVSDDSGAAWRVVSLSPGVLLPETREPPLVGQRHLHEPPTNALISRDAFVDSHRMHRCPPPGKTSSRPSRTVEAM